MSVRADCDETFRNLSRDPPPVGSLHPFGLRHKPLSPSLQCGVRFLRHPLPASPSVRLTAPYLSEKEEYGLTMFRMI
ncbi:hypothetical protein QUF80_13075 [Desulfococcaceae bacterium HSG8]|nr:hypothetical protein [Desulfococcaceae bacterium HSG8]